ncbi:hypothetical protein [Noviherbaspirillum saxi]|uniref:Uncharacterized protein n=1 Tax=Noviherbaspirillum saxi TaxID=2320863 RepID=A0A3A3FSL1_9BURK|nr:hypothetical protein [Noviherbaspirillum saxi]RJF99036.1 hypothetical protein D3871_11330 [Noviherbaspirillum saxi]
MMAGDWIKMRGNLWDDPRISKLCDLTDCGEAQIIGGLYWLWSTADQHTEDGCMPGLTMRQIDRKTGIPGFAAALCEIEWVKDDTQGVVIPRFTEHNGSSAKRRCMDAQRKANSRNPSASDADNGQTEDGQNPPNCGAREREEKNIREIGAGATPVEISIALRTAGIKSQPADPRLIALADQMVSIDTVKAACEEAKRAKRGEQVNVGYIVKVIESWAKQAKELQAEGASTPKKSDGAWWATDATIAAKGTEFGLIANPGESMQQFKGRIQAAIDNGGKPPAPKPAPAIVIRPSVADEKPAVSEANRKAALQAAKAIRVPA